MNKFIKRIFLSLLFFASVPLSLYSQAVKKDCLKEVEKVISYYKSHYDKRKMYMMYSTQSIEGAVPGDKLTSEIWIAEKKYKYENTFVKVYQDEKVQVSILNDKKLVILRSVPHNTNKPSFPDISLLAQLDSIKTNCTNINCTESKGVKVVNLEFPKFLSGRPNVLKKISLYYLPSGEFKKGEYTFYNAKNPRTDVYEYIKVKDAFDNSILSEPALAHVMADGKVKKEFKNYTIKDLRNNKSN